MNTKNGKIITLSKFRSICEERDLKRFIFDMDNQNEPLSDLPIKAVAEYNTLSVYYNPNVVIFRNDRSTLYLKDVQSVCVVEDNPLSGFLFSFICRDYRKSSFADYVIAAE